MTEINQISLGSGDVIARDKIINNAYYKSAEYKDLTERIAELREDAEETINSERRLSKLQKLNEAVDQLEQFKKDVTHLYETFSKIEINTERLRLARDHFENGQIREADAILKAEDLADDQEKLLDQLGKSEDKVLAIKENLKNNANEFLVKAQTTAALFNDPDWFDKSAEYYKRSIQSFEGMDNLFEFGNFLIKNKAIEAGGYFERSLKYATLDVDKFTINNNLGNFYTDIGEDDKAMVVYTEALNIMRELNKTDTQQWKPRLASVLNNLGVLFINKNLENAERYLFEAYELRKQLVELDWEKYGNDLARILTNLARLYIGKSDFENAEIASKEAISTQERLQETNPGFYRSQIALSVMNLGAIQLLKGDFDKAIEYGLKSVQAQEQLAEENPYLYLNDLVDSYQRMAVIYSGDRHNEEKWNLKAIEGLKLLGRNNPQLKLPVLASYQNILGKKYIENNEPDKAERMFLDEIDTFRILANKYPTAYSQDVSFKLIKMSDFYYDHQDSEKEEAVLREALEITKELASAHPDNFEPDMGLIYQNLGFICSKKSELSEAKSYQEEAIKIYKKLVEKDTSKYKPKVVQVMISLADTLHYLNNNEKVIDTLEELVNPLKELIETDVVEYYPKLGTVLHNLGIAYTNAFRFDKAEEAYNDALLIRAQLAQYNPQSFESDFITTRTNLLMLSSLKEMFNKMTSKNTDTA